MISNVKKVSKKPFLAFVVLFMFLSSVFGFGISASAVSEEQARQNLTTYVYGKMSQNEYTLNGGGSVKGSDLFEGKPTSGYDLNEKVFTSLSSKAQGQVVSDIASLCNKAVEDDSVRGVEQSTVQDWWKQLQTKQGVGSKFMGEILKNTKPDFVTANQIYAPFSGLVGTLMGIGAVLIMAFLGLVMVADISYITLPPVRLFYSDKTKNGGSSKLFSNDAIFAVQVAEEGGNSADGGEKKQALGIYFKRRVFMLIILGICLLYLVQGQIYTLVGYILDMVSGFLGF